MSRAFIKEGDGALDPLPDLPVSPQPNYVTPAGHAALQSRLRDTQSRLAALKSRPDRLDKLPEAAAERDIRYLEARLKTALLIDPATRPLAHAAFGHAVTVADDNGQESTYTIVGEDEADPATGKIAPHSPLARALIGAAVGDTVTWRKPTGAVTLEILHIAVP